MLIMSRQERERLGLAEALQSCDCRSPQGRRLKSAHRYYGRSEGQALEQEFLAVEQLIDFCRRYPKELAEALHVLSHFRDLQGTLGGLQKHRLLDVTELFEIKQAAGLLKELIHIQHLTEKSGITLTAQTEIEQLLDPEGLGTSGFYLYDAYSAELATLRRERALIEQQIEAGTDDNKSLLAARSLIVDKEEKEERRVRRTLCDALMPFASELSDHLEKVGQIDFRLAKARLALVWGARRPTLLASGETVILEQFYHPKIEAELQTRGSAYERQTIAIARGTTVLSGPNMGGKSVTLKAVTLAMALIHLGYFPPASYAATPLFDAISYSSDHFDTTKKGLSSFASEMVRLRDDIERAKERYCFYVIDEPCRGTNPEEATALVAALSRFYATRQGCLMMATHYPTPEGEGVRHLRIRGIMEDALSLVTGDPAKQLTDEEAISRIESLMDYTIISANGQTPIPQSALQLALWLGMDREFLDLAT